MLDRRPMNTPANWKNIVLVSGAASGIGRTIAELYRAQGVCVHVCDSSAERISASYTPAFSATLHDGAGVDPLDGDEYSGRPRWG